MKLFQSLIAAALTASFVVLPLWAIPDATFANTTASKMARTADPATVTMAVGIQALGVVSAGADLIIDVTITNNSDFPVPAANAHVSLSNEPIITRSALKEWLTGGGSDSAASTVVASQATAEIGSGHTLNLSVNVPAAVLALNGPWGARRILVQLESNNETVTSSRASFVWAPGGATQATPLAITAPLTVPHTTEGMIPADLLATYTSPGGVLTRELEQVLNRNVTLAVDPMIIASIKILGDTVPDSARLWLQSLQGASNDSFALSYADSDLAAGVKAGAPTILTPISFPVNAKFFPGASTAAPTPSSSSTSESPSQSASPVPSPTPSQPVALPTSTTLMALPFTLSGYAWPAAGTLTGTDLSAISAAGYTSSIVSSANVDYQSSEGIHNSSTTLDGHAALVSDDTIADLINAAADQTSDVGWEQAMAELSASVAVASAEQSAEVHSLLAALARNTPGQGGRLSQTLTALFSLPWVSASSIKALAQSHSEATLTPSAEPEGRTAQVASMLSSEATVARFSSVLSDPTPLTGERRLSLLATLGNGWIGAGSAWPSAAAKYIKKSNDLVSSVKIAASSSLFITSKNSHVDVTVQNLLAYPVTVMVAVRSPNGILAILNPRLKLTIEANSQAKASVPVTSLANGNLTLAISLTSLSEVPIAQPASVKVDVQAGWETAFTAVIAGLLVILFGFGIFRTIRKRRRRVQVPMDDSVPESPDSSIA